jgi:uncharacterized protein (DUF1778 family)
MFDPCCQCAYNGAMSRGVNEGHSVRMFVRLQPEQRDEARKAAKIAGIEFSEWVRRTINRAATRTIAAHKAKRKLVRR